MRSNIPPRVLQTLHKQYKSAANILATQAKNAGKPCPNWNSVTQEWYSHDKATHTLVPIALADISVSYARRIRDYVSRKNYISIPEINELANQYMHTDTQTSDPETPLPF